MYTGDWWWSVQVCHQILVIIYTDKEHQATLEVHQPGATIIPVIMSSNEMLLTHFQDKMAYPIYLTIGNIPKEIHQKPSHHTQLLIGYIPTTKLASITNKAAHHCMLANLFHVCMQIVLGPINSYGEIGIAMISGDSV
jgi:hypothetical protein